MKIYCFSILLFLASFTKANAQDDVTNYLKLLKNTRERIFSGPALKDSINAAYPGIKTALQQLITVKNIPASMEIVHELTYFWEMTGRMSEGRKWYSLVLQLPSTAAHDSLRGLVLMDEGYLAFRQTDNKTAKSKTLEAKKIFERLHDDQNGLERGYTLQGSR
jgi:hypothetical protein